MMMKADGWMTRVSNCVGRLIRKWEEVGVKYGISHHWFQPDSESLQSKLTSVTALVSVRLRVTLSQTRHQSSCKFEPRQLLRLTVLSLKLIAHHGGFSR